MIVPLTGTRATPPNAALMTETAADEPRSAHADDEEEEAGRTALSNTEKKDEMEESEE